MKKILTLFALLVLTVTGAQAQTITATYGKGNGTFYNASGTAVSSGFDAKKFVSNTTPAVTWEASVNNTALNSGDAANGARIGLNAGTETITMSVPEGYQIVSYSFKGQGVQAGHPARTIQTESGASYTNSGNSTQTSVSETDINKQSTYFTVTTTAWSPLKTFDFKVIVQDLRRWVNFNRYDENNELIDVVQSENFYLDGQTIDDVTTIVPAIAGKTVASVSPQSITFDGADVDVEVHYAASSFDYTVAINAGNPKGTVMTTESVPEGTVVKINNEEVANGGNVSYDAAVTEDDIEVTFPAGYEYMAASKEISGTNITVTCYDPRWMIVFSKDQKYTRTDRFINNVRIGSKTFAITNNGLNTPAYRDFTSDVLVVPAGATLTPAIGYEGAWMHGFFYVDLDNDGVFYVANPDHTTSANTEYNGELLSYGNEGNALNSGHQEMPAFTMPTTPGDYRARFKMDWSSTDPAGNPGTDANDVSSNNHIIKNGGTIVDIILRIQDPCELLPDEIETAQAAYNNVSDMVGTLGYPKQEVVDALSEAISAAENANGEGCAQHIEALIAAVEAVNAVENRVMPQAGNFYRIKGVAGGRYLQSTVSTTAADGRAGVRLGATDNADVTTIFYLDGNKLLGYSNGLYVTNTCDFNNLNSADATTFTITARDAFGEFAVKNGSTFLFSWDGTTNYCFDRQGSDAAQCRMAIEAVEELPITLRSTDGENYFATFSAPVNVQITGAALNNVVKKTKTASYEAVDTDMLPAGTGVLLTGTDASATATIITTDVAAADYGLVRYYAATAGTSATDKLYLGKGKTSGKAGFYKLGNGTTSNGFKAYLEDTAAASGEAKEGFELVFGGEVTGINTIENAADNGAVFNLQGQRVNKAQKGVYIQNGKKVVLK